jgi:hypothetical protein
MRRSLRSEGCTAGSLQKKRTQPASAQRTTTKPFSRKRRSISGRSAWLTCSSSSQERKRSGIFCNTPTDGSISARPMPVIMAAFSWPIRMRRTTSASLPWEPSVYTVNADPGPSEAR